MHDLPTQAEKIHDLTPVRRISGLSSHWVIARMELALGDQLLQAIPFAEALKQDRWAWYDFQELLKRHGLKAPSDEDQEDALFHVIRWTMRDLKGWSDKMSRECCEDILLHQSIHASEPDDLRELTSSDIAHMLEWARFFRRKKSD